MKLFKLPGPKELGLSEYSALESSTFSPFTKNPTWEDYRQIIKSMYPVRYFFNEVLDLKLSVWKRRCSDAYWAIRHCTINKFHKVDLRGVDEYTYGYLDPCEQMRLAIWKIFLEYVSTCEPTDPSTMYPLDEQDSEEYKVAKAQYDEIEHLKHWWYLMRPAIKKAEDIMYEEAKKAGNEAEYEEAMSEWAAFSRLQDEVEEENLQRVVKLRPYLWR